MSIVVHHNPDCGTSRNVLEIIRASGAEPVVIEYLKTGWTKPQLLALFAAAVPAVVTVTANDFGSVRSRDVSRLQASQSK